MLEAAAKCKLNVLGVMETLKQNGWSKSGWLTLTNYSMLLQGWKIASKIP